MLDAIFIPKGSVQKTMLYVGQASAFARFELLEYYKLMGCTLKFNPYSTVRTSKEKSNATHYPKSTKIVH